MQPERVNVLGLPVDVVDMPLALEWAEERIASNLPPGSILSANPEKVYALRASPLLQRLFPEAALIVPDGIGVVWAMHLLQRCRVSRVAGSDLMPALCALSAKRGYRIFIYGSSEETSRGATATLQRRYPGLQVAGRQHGFLASKEMPTLIDRINASKTDILFVALGTPRQEQWMDAHLPQLDVRLCQGVGGTLDTIHGSVRRAPLFMQKLHLEWFFRLLSQPLRIWRQRVLAFFVIEVLVEKLRHTRSATL